MGHAPYNVRKRKFTANEEDREGYVMNDESVYLHYLRSKMSLRAYVRKYRVELNDYIRKEAGQD